MSEQHKSPDAHVARPPRGGWQRPAIEWEEPYEPVVFSASCTSQPFNCGAGARD